MAKWETLLDGPEYKHRSIKTKINKNVYCKKNVIAPKTFGFHTYGGSNTCTRCGHIKKDRQRRY